MRPKQPTSSKKQPCNISLSKTALEKLDELQELYKQPTRSALFEAIGQGELVLKPYNSKSIYGIPMYRRLNALSSEPVAAFASVMCFANYGYRQFGQKPLTERLVSALLKASSVLLYIGFLLPDTPINNPSSLLKYILFEVINSAATDRRIELHEVAGDESAKDKAIEYCMAAVGKAIERLELLKSPDPFYKMLRAKSIHGFSVKEIARIHAVTNRQMHKEEVARHIKKGLRNFRENFYEKPLLDIPAKAKEVRERLFEKDAAVYHDVMAYVRLCTQPAGYLRTHTNERENLRRILRNTSHSAYLDLWLNEIDAHFGHYPKDVLEKYRMVLETSMEGQRDHLERRLKECETHQDLRRLLEDVTAYEVGTRIPITFLLGEHAPDWLRDAPLQRKQDQQVENNPTENFLVQASDQDINLI